MAIIPEEIKCDHVGCGQTRRDVNHWFAVRVKEFEAGRKIEIYDWDAAVADNIIRECKHYCGQAHMVNLIQQLTEKKTPLSEPKPLHVSAIESAVTGTLV